MEQIQRERALNVPNLLTVARIALLPAILWQYRRGQTDAALMLYLVAMLTDVADGLIARAFHQMTALGKLLDPIADKLSLLALLGLFTADGQIPVWLTRLILLKEAVLIAGSAVALRRGVVVSALPIGKATTAAFVLSMALRFAGRRRMADVLLGISVALSLVSLAWYAVNWLGRMRSAAQERTS